jgi:rRNA maturation RNase YbeY
MSDNSIVFHFENVAFPNFVEEQISKWIDSSIASENKITGTINCIFCDDEYLLNINQTYLNHDTFTDIVTFNYVENNQISGDLFISIERVKENAETFNVSFERELKRVIIHGVLHLIGFNDKTPEEVEQIRAKEDFYLTLCAD